jgi:hypothetical protein
MRWRHLIIFAAFCLSLFANAQNELEWSHDRRLVYDDFKGAISANESKQTKATTYSIIDLDVKQVGQEIQASVRTLFKYDNSWMRSDSKNAYTLKHEQGHFDISEIYARKLRKKLAGIKVKRKGGNEQIVGIAKKMIKKHLKAQAKYDQATGFAIKEKNQAEYIIKIEKELKELEGYKDSKVVMKFR